MKVIINNAVICVILLLFVTYFYDAFKSMKLKKHTNANFPVKIISLHC